MQELKPKRYKILKMYEFKTHHLLKFCNTTSQNIHSVNLMLFWPASSLICGNKMPIRCNRGFYCRSYCLLNMFRASPCPSSGAQEYYTVVAACGILCCGFSSSTSTAQNTTRSNHCIILLSSWWWAWWCPKHVEQAIRSAIKTSVASSWHFISHINDDALSK